MKIHFKLIAFVNFWLAVAIADSDNNFSNHHVNRSLPTRPTNFLQNDLQHLSELPIEKLLKVRKSLTDLIESKFDVHPMSELSDMQSRMIDDISERTFFNSKATSPAPPPFMSIAERQLIRKTGWSSAMENPWDTKPTKIQTFFQISITALAFLSFAGYLLCMIVQAIKSKGTRYSASLPFMLSVDFKFDDKFSPLPGTMYMYNSNAMGLTSGTGTMNALMNAGSVPLRKRRPIGRRKRDVFLSADNRNGTQLFDDKGAFIDPAEIYTIMIQGAEDYTKLYHLQ